MHPPRHRADRDGLRRHRHLGGRGNRRRERHRGLRRHRRRHHGSYRLHLHRGDRRGDHRRRRDHGHRGLAAGHRDDRLRRAVRLADAGACCRAWRQDEGRHPVVGGRLGEAVRQHPAAAAGRDARRAAGWRTGCCRRAERAGLAGGHRASASGHREPAEHWVPQRRGPAPARAGPAVRQPPRGRREPGAPAGRPGAVRQAAGLPAWVPTSVNSPRWARPRLVLRLPAWAPRGAHRRSSRCRCSAPSRAPAWRRRAPHGVDAQRAPRRLTMLI
jgi:hypothetical protein